MDTTALATALSTALAALESEPGPRFVEVLDAYERVHVPTLAGDTRENYLSCGRQLRATDLPDRRMGEITLLQVLEAARVSEGAAGRSVVGRHVHRVYAWARATGRWTGANPAAEVPVYRAPVPQGALDEGEARLLLRHLAQPKVGSCWTRLCLQYIATTGHRSGEALSLTREAVRPSSSGGAWVDLPRTKAGPQRRVISEAALAIVRRACDRETGLVFRPSTITIGSGRSALRKTLKRACVAAGLRPRRVHDLRHTVASLLNARGVGLADVAALLGHTSTRSTLRYLHGNRREQRSAIQQLGSALTGDA